MCKLKVYNNYNPNGQTTFNLLFNVEQLTNPQRAILKDNCEEQGRDRTLTLLVKERGQTKTRMPFKETAAPVATPISPIFVVLTYLSALPSGNPTLKIFEHTIHLPPLYSCFYLIILHFLYLMDKSKIQLYLFVNILVYIVI